MYFTTRVGALSEYNSALSQFCILTLDVGGGGLSPVKKVLHMASYLPDISVTLPTNPLIRVQAPHRRTASYRGIRKRLRRGLLTNQEATILQEVSKLCDDQFPVFGGILSKDADIRNGPPAPDSSSS